MSFSIYEILSWIVVAFSVVYFAHKIKIRKEHSVVFENIPGPTAYPVIGSAYRFLLAKREDRYALKQQLHSEFPSIMCLWYGMRPHVSLKRAEHLEKILCNSKEHLQKGWAYEHIRPWLGDGLIMSSGAKWHKMRKFLTPAFHFAILERYCEIFSEKANDLMEQIQPFADGGQSFKFYPLITSTTLDIVAEAAMGTKISASNSKHKEYVDSVYNSSLLFVKRILTPWHSTQFIYDLSSSGRWFADCCRILHAFTNEVIADRRKSHENPLIYIDLIKKQRPAFLDLLLVQNENTKTPLTNTEIRDEVENIMFAGHDTTSSAISWTVYQLCRHPDIQEMIFAEIQSVFDDPDRRPNTHDLNKLELLDRVIKETIRLYPPVPFIARELSEDVQIDSNLNLPKGTHISVEITLLHRDPRYFPDPERFDPDRFLPENVLGRHPLSYVPFSAGSRNCIGQKFAVYEMKCILVALIQNFQFKGVGKEEIPIEEIIAKPLYGVEIICNRRI